jgi:hypothetical protein
MLLCALFLNLFLSCPLCFNPRVSRTNCQFLRVCGNVENYSASKLIALVLAPLGTVILRDHLLDSMLSSPFVCHFIDLSLRVFVPCCLLRTTFTNFSEAG